MISREVGTIPYGITQERWILPMPYLGKAAGPGAINVRNFATPEIPMSGTVLPAEPTTTREVETTSWQVASPTGDGAINARRCALPGTRSQVRVRTAEFTTTAEAATIRCKFDAPRPLGLVAPGIGDGRTNRRIGVGADSVVRRLLASLKVRSFPGSQPSGSIDL